jgi:hypothetical protein
MRPPVILSTLSIPIVVGAAIRSGFGRLDKEPSGPPVPRRGWLSDCHEI